MAKVMKGEIINTVDRITDLAPCGCGEFYRPGRDGAPIRCFRQCQDNAAHLRDVLKFLRVETLRRWSDHERSRLDVHYFFAKLLREEIARRGFSTDPTCDASQLSLFV